MTVLEKKKPRSNYYKTHLIGKDSHKLIVKEWKTIY